MSNWARQFAALVVTSLLVHGPAFAAERPSKTGLGRAALPEEIAAWDIDVQPDGRGLLLTEGVMRARNRDPTNEGRFNSTALTTLEPGAVYRYTIKFWRGTANRFLTGHRIRVEISSSWYPYFLPNLNTGADNLATVSISQAVVARQTIHHGPRNPSHLVLPIVPLRPPQGR